LPDTDEVALELASIIREKQPDTLITHWKNSIHRDHEYTAKLTERARFLAALPIDHELPRHSVKTFLHAENWEDMEGFAPTTYVPIPDEAFYRWVNAIRHQAFATRGCLAGYPRATAFAAPHTPEVTKLAGP